MHSFALSVPSLNRKLAAHIGKLELALDPGLLSPGSAALRTIVYPPSIPRLSKSHAGEVIAQPCWQPYSASFRQCSLP